MLHSPTQQGAANPDTLYFHTSTTLASNYLVPNIRITVITKRQNNKRDQRFWALATLCEMGTGVWISAGWTWPAGWFFRTNGPLVQATVTAATGPPFTRCLGVGRLFRSRIGQAGLIRPYHHHQLQRSSKSHTQHWPEGACCVRHFLSHWSRWCCCCCCYRCCHRHHHPRGGGGGWLRESYLGSDL